MDKSTILKAFNTQFEEFLEDISILFPSNNDNLLSMEYD